MTSGYVCEVVDTKVERVAFLPADAGLSWYGIRILDAIAEGVISEWINTKKAESTRDITEGFNLSWVRHTKDNRDWNRSDFAEYGYVYNRKAHKLSIYHYGTLVCIVKPQEAEEYAKYHYYFGHYNEIESILRYNCKTMSYDYKKSLKSRITEASLSQLMEWVDQAAEPRAELEDLHCIMPGHAPERAVYVYGKNFSVSNVPMRHIWFICEKPFMENKWDVLIQLPYKRVCIARKLSSERAAVNELRRIIRSVDIKRLIRFEEINDLITTADRLNQLQEVLPILDKEWEQPWFTPNGQFSPQEIRKHYSYFSRNRKQANL